MLLDLKLKFQNRTRATWVNLLWSHPRVYLVSGSAFVQSLTETSALRFKKDIEEMDSQLNTVYNLRPVDFTWKANDEEDKGLIAEEVQLLYPEFVTLNEDGTTQGIKYSKLVSVLVKSIQELKDEVEILKAKVNG